MFQVLSGRLYSPNANNRRTPSKSPELNPIFEDTQARLQLDPMGLTDDGQEVDTSDLLKSAVLSGELYSPKGASAERERRLSNPDIPPDEDTSGKACRICIRDQTALCAHV